MYISGSAGSEFWSEIILAGVLFAAALMVRKFVPAALERHGEGSRVKLWAEGAIPPLMYLLIVVALCSALTAVASLFEGERGSLAVFAEKAPLAADKIVGVAAVVCIGWAIIGANRRSSFFLSYGAQDKDVSRQALLRFSSTLLSVVVAVFVVVIAVTELGYNIAGILTGIGLGGLTVVLAVREAAANFFSGAVIVTERPFEIGDYIRTTAAEGTVVDVNMRSTTIRNNSGAITVVPNAVIAGGAITNWSSGVEERRIEMDICFEYGARAEDLRAFIDAARAVLSGDDNIDAEKQAVHLYELGGRGPVVKVYCYTKNPDYHDYLRARERIVYALMGIAESNGLDFAVSYWRELK